MRYHRRLGGIKSINLSEQINLLHKKSLYYEFTVYTQ